MDLPNENNILEESYDIVVFALNHHLPNQWENNEILDTEEAKILFKDLNEKAIPAIRRIKYASMQKENTSHDDTVILNRYLQTMNQKLQANTFIMGAPSAVDILIFPNLRQLIIHDDNWLDRYDFNNIKRWMSHWTESDIFKRIFTNQPLWNKDQTPIVINNNPTTSL